MIATLMHKITTERFATNKMLAVMADEVFPGAFAKDFAESEKRVRTMGATKSGLIMRVRDDD